MKDCWVSFELKSSFSAKFYELTANSVSDKMTSQHHKRHPPPRSLRMLPLLPLLQAALRAAAVVAAVAAALWRRPLGAEAMEVTAVSFQDGGPATESTMLEYR